MLITDGLLSSCDRHGTILITGGGKGRKHVHRRGIRTSVNSASNQPFARPHPPTAARPAAPLTGRPLLPPRRFPVETTSPLAADDANAATDKEIVDYIFHKRIGEAAHHCYRRLQAKSPPALPVCSALIQGLLREHRFPAAWQLFCRLRECGVALNKYTTLHFLLTGAVKCRRCNEALRVLHYMTDIGLRPNEATLVVLINGLLKTKKRGTPFRRIALDLWSRMEAAERDGTPRNAAIFTTGLHVHVSMGQFREADELLASMAAAGLPPTVIQYNVIMQGHSLRGDAAAVRAVFRRIKAGGVAPDATTFNIFMQCYVRRREPVLARAVLDKALREGVQLCIRSYTIYMRALCQEGMVDDAAKVLATCKAAKMRPTATTYGVLIHGYARNGRLAEAERLLEEMKAHGPLPTVIIFNTIISAHVSSLTTAGFTSGLRVLRSMSALGIPPEADTFNVMMDALVRLPDMAGATRVFAQVAELGLPIDATLYTTLIKMFKVTGEADAAVKVFAEMRGSHDAAADETAWNALVDVLACSGRFDEAEQAARLAAAEGASRQLPVSVEGYGALINGFHRHNKVEAAVACLRRYLQLGGQPDKMMYDQVIDLCLRNGDVKTAFQVVRAMELAGLQVDKQQYKAWFDKYSSYDASSPLTYPAIQGPPRGGDGYNVHVERFKFWLGMKNKYYTGGWP